MYCTSGKTNNNVAVPTRVTVKDVGGLTDTGFLTINIADTNDFTPSFDLDIYTVFLLPSETVGTIIGNFTATDK
jgi:hypothetical protein